MNIEYFPSMARFEADAPPGWDRIRKIIQEIDLPYTCIIGIEDYASKIALVLDKEGERQDKLLYPKHKLLQIDKMELTRDIFESAQRPLGHKKRNNSKRFQ